MNAAHDYFDHVSGNKPAYDMLPAPAANDALAAVIREHIKTRPGYFIVKSNGKSVGCFSYRDEASFREAGERARICAAKFDRGTVVQVCL